MKNIQTEQKASNMEEKINQQIQDVTTTTMLGPVGPTIKQPEITESVAVLQTKEPETVSTGMTRTPEGPKNYSVTDTRTKPQGDPMGIVGATSLSDTSGTTRPLDGTEGSPYYLDTDVAYPKVEPYALKMPDLGLEFKVTTLNPRKAAWEAATKYAGVPLDYYTGYYYTGMREDTFREAVGKNIPKIVGVAGDVFTTPAAILGWGNKMIAEQVGDNAFGRTADAVGDWLVGVWNTKERWGQEATKHLQLNTDKSGFLGLLAQAPQALAYTFGSLGLMRAGLSAAGASLATEMSIAGHIADALDEKGYAPTDIFVRSLAGGLTSSAINAPALKNYSIGNSFIAPITNKIGQTAIRKGVMDSLVRLGYSETRKAASAIATDFAHHTLRRWGNRIATTGFKGLAEFGTETAQSLTESAFSAAITPESWRTELDKAIGEGVLGLAAGVALASPDIATEYRKIRAEKEIGKAVSQPIVQSLLDTRAKLVSDLTSRGMPQSEAEGFIDYMTDHTLEEVEQKLGEIFTGELDKFSNADQAEFSTKIAPLMDDGGISTQQMQDLDSRVEVALSEVKSFTESDKQFIKGLFRSMANVLAYQGVSPSNIAVPKFTEVETETEMGWYNPETHEFNINPMINAYGTSLFDTRGIFKEGAEQNTLSPRHRAILHEFGHLLDVAVGLKGFGRFFEQYYATIQEQFGRQVTKQVRNTAEQELGGDRTSKRPKTASETSPAQTTEYFAQALSRATAARIMKAVGAQGKVSDFVAYANLVINGMMQVGTISQAVTEYMSALQENIQKNSKTLKQLVESQLDFMSRNKNTKEQALKLQSKLKRFLDADVTSPEQVGLTAEELNSLVEVLNGFLGGEGVIIAQQVFEGVDTEAFNAKAVEYLQNTFNADQKEFEEKQKKAEEDAKKKAKKDKAVADRNAKAEEAGVDENELPIFDNLPDNALPSKATGFYVEESAYDIPEIVSESESEEESKNKQFDMRINTKIDGRTLLQDINETNAALDEYRPKAEKDTVANKVYKYLYTKDMLTNVDEILRVAGGEELASKYGVVKSAQKATDRLFEYHTALDKKLHGIIGKGLKYDSEKWRFARDKFLAESAERNIEAVRRDPVLTDKQVPVSLNAFEAMTVYRMLKQTANQANIRINNVFLGKAQEIADRLSPEQKAYADAMGEIMGEGWSKYIEIALSEYEGRQYNIVDNYTPIYDAINNLYVGNLSQNSFSRSTQERDIEPVDMRMVFNVYMGRIANYEGGYYQKLRRLNDMVAFNPDTEFTGRMTESELNAKHAVEIESRKLRLRLESVLGKNGADVFVRGLQDSLNNHAYKDVPNGLIGSASRNIVSSLLAFNPLSLPKNATNISVFMGMGVPRYGERFAQGLANPAETWKLMMSISGLKQRLGGEGIDEHLDSSNVGSDSFSGIFMGTKAYANAAKTMPWLRPLMANMTAFSAMVKRFGMKTFMQTGDAISNVYGAYPLYLHATEDLGMSHEEAGQYVMQAINERQSSSNKAVKTFGVRRFNRQGLGGLTAFSTEQVNKLRSVIRDWAMANRGDLAEAQARADIAAIISTFVLFSLISAGAGDLFSDDDDIKAEAQNALLREGLQSMLGFHPLGGSFAAPAIMYMMGLGQPSGISVPASSYAMNMIKDAKGGDITGFLSDIAGVTGAFVGLDRVQNSWDGALDVVFGETVEQVAAGYRQLWGRSEGFAKKRTGYKEPVAKDEE